MLKKLELFLQKKLFDIKILFYIGCITLVVFLLSDNITRNKTKIILDNKFSLYSQKLQNEIQVLLNNKKESTLSIALSLAQDTNLKKALRTKDINSLKLKEFSQKLREHTRFKNVWFHIIDNKGTAFYRSWMDKRGDSVIDFRLDVSKMIKNPHIMNTISTGKFDMTFKSMVPIYDEGKFVGIFEVITHFNSIVKQLQKNGISTIILVDKKYKKQLTKSMTNTFISDYYVANLSADKRLLSYMKNKTDQLFNSKKNYIIDRDFNKMIVLYNIPDVNEKPMGTIVTFKNLDEINMNDIKLIETNMTIYLVLFVLLMLLGGYYTVNRKSSKKLDALVNERTQELDTEKNYIQTILDTNPSIIFVLNNATLIRGNKSFFDFFNCKNVEDFNINNKSMSEYFSLLDNVAFQDNNELNGESWLEYLITRKQTDHIVNVLLNKEIYYFTISAFQLMQKDETLITMQNITELKNKDKLLYEQSKMASLGEMIGNIAHQWRQPLSIISTGATGMKIQKEYGLLKDTEFYKNCDMINDNAQYLSKTIDDFKNFVQGDSTPKDFEFLKVRDDFLNIVDASIKKYQIQIVLTDFESESMRGYPNELIQCFINIFNNAKDALVENKSEENRYFFISHIIESDKIIIEFKDNGNGIDDSILNKIFDPYFTTKHQSQGTGLGLNMTYNLIVNGMKGDIVATNILYEYKGKKYKGASFQISLPRD
jgi:signal transduction histidine kinase